MWQASVVTNTLVMAIQYDTVVDSYTSSRHGGVVLQFCASGQYCRIVGYTVQNVQLVVNT